ncbi:hypothetical protein BASA62_005882 [Batrachochytrium salamandrivorans]|nr:hypothetical protein BASA62_005882 [Batrachochytrium salamandrivorans]
MKEQYEMMSCLSGAERILFAAITTIKIGFLVWRCNWDRIFARSSVRWQKDDSFRKTRVEDLIFDYGSETEQSQQMGKKESNVSSVYQFCDQGQSQQGSKGCFRFLMLEKGTKTILQFWLVDGLEFPQLRDLALQVFGMGVLKCRVREEFFHHGGLSIPS